MIRSRGTPGHHTPRAEHHMPRGSVPCSWRTLLLAAAACLVVVCCFVFFQSEHSYPATLIAGALLVHCVYTWHAHCVPVQRHRWSKSSMAECSTQSSPCVRSRSHCMIMEHLHMQTTADLCILCTLHKNCVSEHVCMCLLAVLYITVSRRPQAWELC